MTAVTQNEFAIHAAGLTKRYRDAVALDGLDLNVQQGTTFGLLGPNGAGKSTAIRIMMGLTEFDEGLVEVLDHRVDRRPSQLRQRVGYVPELHHMYGWMTVAEILDFAGRLFDTWDSSLADDLQTQFALPGDRKVRQLSKGMTAKLGLLVALAHRPDLLILDEPTSGLDPVIREDFLESILRSDHSADRTVLFSSHHVDDVERIADDVGILVGGRMVLRGSVEDLRSSVKRIQCVLVDGRLPPDPPPATVRQQINRRQWTLTMNDFDDELVEHLLAEDSVERVEVIDLSLEEIFKDVVRGIAGGSLEDPSC